MVAVTLMLFFTRLYSNCRPYIDEPISSLKILTQWQIYVVYFVALLLKTEAFTSHGYDIALQVFLILAMLGNLVLEVSQHVSAQTRTRLCSPAISEKEIDESNASNPIHEVNCVDARESHPQSYSEVDDDSSTQSGIRMSVIPRASNNSVKSGSIV